MKKEGQLLLCSLFEVTQLLAFDLGIVTDVRHNDFLDIGVFKESRVEIPYQELSNKEYCPSQPVA
jgi:hypothetical protein